MPDEYREHISGARDLLELAAETAEGRAAIRRWCGQVIEALPEDEPAVPDPAAERRAAQVRAARELGYTTIALSETASAGIGLYPDIPGVQAAGHYEDSGLYPGRPGQAGSGGTMQDDMAALHQAAAQDEIDRYALMMQGRRPGPARPQYAGLSVSEPRPLDEPDDADIIQATMQLAGITEGGATFRDVAEAVDELALSRTPETHRETSSRADALVSLAGMFPARTPAAGELDLELARQREIARIAREHGRGAAGRIARRQGAEPDEAETAQEEVDSIVERHRDMLSHAPRQGRTHLSSDEDYDKFGRQNDGGQPARGGVMHPEVERLAREHGLLVGWSPNTTYPVLSPRERERAERRARPGHQAGLFSIEQMHRKAMRSAASSRG
jgi:hypothetical protein